MPALVRALKSVDLPTLGRPTMPHLRDMDFPYPGVLGWKLTQMIPDCKAALDALAMQLLLGRREIAAGNARPGEQAAV